MKFVVMSPRQTGGGAIVLHLLCKLLREYGHDARIFYYGPSSMKDIKHSVYCFLYVKWLLFHDIKKIFLKKLLKKTKLVNTDRFSGYNYEPVKKCKRKWLPWVDSKTIVIYPETIYGNPLQAGNIVRYFMSFNCYPGDYKAYGKDDLFFSFRRIFNDIKVNPKCRLMRIRNFDYDLYKNTNQGKRYSTCYIVRKGINRKDLPKSFNGIVVDNLPEQEKVEVFNKAKYCISYDTQTFYSSIASICGCISIVMPEEGKTRTDYTDADDKICGVAYGTSQEEIQYAISTRSELIEKIKSFQDKNKMAVEFFISECRKKFFNKTEGEDICRRNS